MERKKKNSGLIIISMILIMLGTLGIVFAETGGGTGTGGGMGDGTSTSTEAAIDLSTISVTTTGGGISAPAWLTKVTDGAITTAGIDTNAFIDSNIALKFNVDVAADEDTKAKINLQKINSDGKIGSAILITSSGITISNKNVTINPTLDLAIRTYYLITVSPGVKASGGGIETSTTYQAIFKTGSERLVPIEPVITTFSAISLYPTDKAQDVAVDSTFDVGFTYAIATSNSITNGKAIELLDKESGTTLAAVFTVSENLMAINITPKEGLAYGKAYQIKIVSGKITKATEPAVTIPQTTMEFRTTSFSQVTASAITSGAGLHIDVNLTNASTTDQGVKIGYVIRRDKGARIEDGGTLVISGVTDSVFSCLGGQAATIPIDLEDISRDQYEKPLVGSVYVDIFVLSESGTVLTNPIHICAQ